MGSDSAQKVRFISAREPSRAIAEGIFASHLPEVHGVVRRNRVGGGGERQALQGRTRGDTLSVGATRAPLTSRIDCRATKRPDQRAFTRVKSSAPFLSAVA